MTEKPEIPETMVAVRKLESEVGATWVEDQPVPEYAANEVLVKIDATAICGTDVNIWNWTKWAEGRIPVPQTMGHEFAGTVVAKGAHVRTIEVGDYISGETHIPCMECKQCLTGDMHICANLKILGVDTDGAFAQYIAVPELVCWKNDRKIEPKYACVQEPLGNAVYTTLVTPVHGQSVVIIGDGPTGLLAAGVARVSGATSIYHIGRHNYRLKIAKKMGADVVLNDNEVDVVAEIKKDNPHGVDIVLEMAGSEAAINQSLSLVRKGGRMSAFGVAKDKVTIDYNTALTFGAATIYGINGRRMFEDWYMVRNFLASGRLNIGPVITHTLKLSEFEKGFDLMNNRPKKCGKVVLIPPK